MARLMYARSLVPSDASMSLRISSSDNASASTSASLRWAYSVTSVMATLHHIPTRQWGDPSGEKAGRRAMTALETTGLWKSHAKTHSVPGPRRLLRRRTPNVSVTKRGCIIRTLWKPNRYLRQPVTAKRTRPELVTLTWSVGGVGAGLTHPIETWIGLDLRAVMAASTTIGAHAG
jgi:hypothetical protein